MKSSINHPKKKQGVPSIRLQATRTNKTKHALYRVMAENDATNDRDDVTQDFYEGFLFRENFNYSMTPHSFPVLSPNVVTHVFILKPISL